MLDENISINDLKEQIRNLVYEKDSLVACNYCNGRDYSVKIINAAEQTKKPLPYKKNKEVEEEEAEQINIY